MRATVHPLPDTFHCQEVRREEHLAVGLSDAAPDDHVDQAMLVLHRDEGDAARGGRALSKHDQPRDAYPASIGTLLQRATVHATHCAQALPQLAQWMWPEADADPRIVGLGIFDDARQGQHGQKLTLELTRMKASG